ncbi:MAG: sortase [Candidatus Saccharimonadaceae bacterium]|nr:sortase [Candidatus Saccharimonadaceae bacterium]
MRPDEVKNGQGGAIDPISSSQAAAANVVRAQINGIYEKNEKVEHVESSVKPLDDTNPYDRTHKTRSQPLPEQWEKYHTAWQNYYKNYYEGYFAQHYSKQPDINQNQGYFSDQKILTDTTDRDKAVFDLRQKLIGRVRESAGDIRKSRHFVPIISGLLVVLVFLILQYSHLLVSNILTYVSPGNINPQNIIINPSDITVGPESRLIIPKINVDVPVIYNVGNDYDSQMTAMTKGVSHFAIPGAGSHPGQIGNTVISGHSSNDLFDKGDYKFIFVQLDKLEPGDTVYANYESKRYTYTVTKKEVVNPNEVNKLVYTTTKPILTLLTCTPVGTSKYRLLVTTEQVSPDPLIAENAPTAENTETETIPGSSSKGFFDWLFSGQW